MCACFKQFSGMCFNINFVLFLASAAQTRLHLLEVLQNASLRFCTRAVCSLLSLHYMLKLVFLFYLSDKPTFVYLCAAYNIHARRPKPSSTNHASSAKNTIQYHRTHFRAYSIDTRRHKPSSFIRKKHVIQYHRTHFRNHSP